jgi:hypothetical protein
MTNPAESSGESVWVLKPPGPGEVHLHIAVGDGVEMTGEVRQAIERLLDALQQEEVQGFRKGGAPKCPELADCTGYWCRPQNNCTSLSSEPCAIHMQCIITPTRFGPLLR